jgi:hypothetical protein
MRSRLLWLLCQKKYFYAEVNVEEILRQVSHGAANDRLRGTQNGTALQQAAFKTGKAVVYQR